MKQFNYNTLIYNDRIEPIENIILDKGKLVHKQLFESALKLFKTIYCMSLNISETEFDSSFIIKEIQVYDYTKPTSINLYYKGKNPEIPKFRNISLINYWPTYFYNKSSDETVYSENNKLSTDDILYVDFVRGKVSVINKFTGIKREIPINLLTKEDLNKLFVKF